MLLLRAAPAAWGSAIAIALLPLLSRHARPGQLPGVLRTLNIDARAPFLFLAVLVALALARIGALRVAAVFIVICGVSYSERHHAYFQYAMAR